MGLVRRLMGMGEVSWKYGNGERQTRQRMNGRMDERTEKRWIDE